MPYQNLVNANITPEDLAAIESHIDGLNRLLPFLINLEPEEIRCLNKMGTSNAAFVEKAHLVALTHPEMLPAIFDMDAYRKKYDLWKIMEKFSYSFGQLNTGALHTVMALGSDTYNFSLDIYDTAKHYSRKAIGMSPVVADMAVNFKRSHHKAKPRLMAIKE